MTMSRDFFMSKIMDRFLLDFYLPRVLIRRKLITLAAWHAWRIDYLEEESMKGFGFFLLAAVMVIGAAGCSDDEVKITSNDPPNPDVVIPYSAPSNNASAIAFEEVTAHLGADPIFTGYIRNVGKKTTESFEVHFNLTVGDLAVQDDAQADMTATILDPGMRTKFEGTPDPDGHTPVTLTYWGMDGTKMTQKYSISIQ